MSRCGLWRSRELCNIQIYIQGGTSENMIVVRFRAYVRDLVKFCQVRNRFGDDGCRGESVVVFVA